jgi:hypothetical protein
VCNIDFPSIVRRSELTPKEVKLLVKSTVLARLVGADRVSFIKGVKRSDKGAIRLRRK